ncbi:MAG TPA: hypothetical protein VKB37_09090 [Jatrophihabitantaceae bacterium]|nr:hypothetical protein [Jatrophihabitantaceae bacterium]
MTRRIRVGGACAAIICLGAAVLLAVVLPGHGAGASENGRHCDDDMQHGSPRSRAVSATHDQHRSEHPGHGKRDCSATKTPSATASVPTTATPTSGATSPIPESEPPHPGHPPAPHPTSLGSESPSTTTPSPSETPSEPGNEGGNGVPNSVPHLPGWFTKHSPPPPSPMAPSTSTSPAPTTSTPPPATRTGTQASSTTTPRATPSLPSVGANAAPANVSHSAGEPGTPTGSGAPAGAPGSPGSTSTPKGGPGDGTHGPGPAANPGGGSHGNAEQAAKNAAKSGADDSVLLAVLILGFAVAVSGVVIVAGRRGGRRVG